MTRGRTTYQSAWHCSPAVQWLLAFAATLVFATLCICAVGQDGARPLSVSAEGWGIARAYADEPAASDKSASAESEEAAPNPLDVVPDSPEDAGVGEGNWVDPTQRADNSFIYDTSIQALSDESPLYNGRIVQVQGEVIGDCVDATDAPGYCWVQLSSNEDTDTSSISVYLSDEQANQIDSYGRYGVTGTQLQVRGEYHQACPEHEGLSDLHATNSAVLEKGYRTPDEFDPDDFFPGIIALMIGFLLMGIFYFARERMR